MIVRTIFGGTSQRLGFEASLCPETGGAMSIYVGIDGGGSKTSWVAVFDDGRLGGHGVLGPSNIHTVGQAGLTAVLKTIVDKVRETTRVQTFDWVNICLGLSGIDRFQIRTVVESVLKELGAKRYRLETDAAIALAGATAGECRGCAGAGERRGRC
jgi:N-acetylglucosamine kinase-like BadF-type ATPase